VWHTLKIMARAPPLPSFTKQIPTCAHFIDLQQQVATITKKNASRLTIRGKQPLTLFEPSEDLFISVYFFRLALWPNKSQHFVHGATFPNNLFFLFVAESGHT
jgi:hypothetical protein